MIARSIADRLGLLSSATNLLAPLICLAMAAASWALIEKPML
jgi:hypothetical protein